MSPPILAKIGLTVILYSLCIAHQRDAYHKINWMGPWYSVSNIESKEYANSSTVADQHNDNQDSDEILHMITADKEKYLCFLPKNNLKNNKNKNETEDELNPYKLLLPIFTRDICSFRLEQYWTYELCHGKYIRQFHHEPSTEKVFSQEYFLGEYDLSQLRSSEKEYEQMHDEFKIKGKKRPTVLVNGIYLHYLEINMTGGTLCDLNNKPRLTRVLYVCNDEARHELFSIKETYSCEYEAVVTTPLLCMHPDFRTNVDNELPIDCYSLGESPQQPRGFSQFTIENSTKSSSE